MSDIALVVADLDGTLLGRDHTAPTARVRGALERVRAAGVPMVICTGRPLSSAVVIGRMLGLPGPHIAFDGALVAVPGEAAIFARPLPEGAAAALVAAARERNLPVELYLAGAHYVDRLWPEASTHASLIQVDPIVRSLDLVIAEARAGEIVKGQLIGDGGPAARERIREVETLGLPLRFAWATPPPGHPPQNYVNVTHPGVDKGVALTALARHLRVPLERVLGIGDGPNDVPLVATAGIGVAMGNGPVELLAVADYVVGSVDEDGFAEAMERWVLVGR